MPFCCFVQWSPDLNNTICVVSGLELFCGAWCTHCSVQRRQWLSLPKNPSVANSSAGSWSRSSWPITDPWLAHDRSSCEDSLQATEAVMRYVYNDCRTLTIAFPIPLLPPSSHLLSVPQYSVLWALEEVMLVSSLGMCSKLAFILTKLSSHESLYSLPFTAKSSYD